MDDPDALLPVESAGNLAGISPRTLRYWIRGGKLPATEGQRGKLVRLGDVLALADLTGKRPAAGRQAAGNAKAATDPARSAGRDAGNAAEGGDQHVVDAGEPAAPPAVAGAMRASLEAIRDEWLAPLIERNGELEREVGAMRERVVWVSGERDQAMADKEVAERERDELHAEVERLRAEDAPVSASAASGAAVPAHEGHGPRQAWWRRLWRVVRPG